MREAHSERRRVVVLVVAAFGWVDELDELVVVDGCGCFVGLLEMASRCACKALRKVASFFALVSSLMKW